MRFTRPAAAAGTSNERTERLMCVLRFLLEVKIELLKKAIDDLRLRFIDDLMF